MKTNLKHDLIKFANYPISATEENIVASYNKEFNTSLTKLTDNEFSILSSQIAFLIADKTKGKRDAIAEFVMKEQYHIFYVELVKHKGFFFALLMYLFTRLNGLY